MEVALNHHDFASDDDWSEDGRTINLRRTIATFREYPSLLRGDGAGANSSFFFPRKLSESKTDYETAHTQLIVPHLPHLSGGGRVGPAHFF